MHNMMLSLVLVLVIEASTTTVIGPLSVSVPVQIGNICKESCITDEMRHQIQEMNLQQQVDEAFGNETFLTLENGAGSDLSDNIREKLEGLRELGNSYSLGRDVHGTLNSFSRDVVGLQLLAVSSVVANYIAERLGLPMNEMGAALDIANVTCPEADRPESPICDVAAKYRTINGSCNNLKFTSWGMSHEPTVRLLPASYRDGVWEPRISVTGDPLPNPRKLSTGIFVERDVPDVLHTHFMMEFAQILAHDTSMSNDMQFNATHALRCCTADGRMLQNPNVGCDAIRIPETDYFYSKYNRTCMEFARTMVASKTDCKLGAANQVNSVTSYIDGSVIYGSDEDLARALRTFTGGLLTTQKSYDGRDFPAESDHPDDLCDIKEGYTACYKSGDRRVNFVPGAAATTTLLLREHNRVASRLARVNRVWDDERLYQEARRIVIAELQHLVYEEYLPLLLGQSFVKQIHLTGRRYHYRPELNPSIVNSWGAATFRAFHSTIPASSKMVNTSRCPVSELVLSDWYFVPSAIQEPSGAFDDLLRGYTTELQQEQDRYYTTQITNLLFKKSTQDFGSDVVAIDIQRGRDHGIPPYNDYRVFCGLPRARSFQDLSATMTQKHTSLLEKHYQSVDDVDLIVGATLETLLPGTLVGPTLQCLNGEQFSRCKFGDRWFYEHTDNSNPFSPDQLAEIRKVTLSRLICDNGDEITRMQRRSLLPISKENPLVSCDGIPKLNLRLWADSPAPFNPTIQP